MWAGKTPRKHHDDRARAGHCDPYHPGCLAGIEAAVSDPDTTGRNQDGTFSAGVSGNPAGRPKGSRNKLTEDFFKALADDFAKNGLQAIIDMRTERPGDYAKMVAGLQTKEVTGEDGAPLFPTEVRWNVRDTGN